MDLVHAGRKLYQLLRKKAVPTAAINEACTSFLLSLSEPHRSDPVTHVLRFTTFINDKGHSKLGTVLKSTAIANNIGCELVSWMMEAKKAVTSEVFDQSAHAATTPPGPVPVPEASQPMEVSAVPTKVKRPSRYKRLQAKWEKLGVAAKQGVEPTKMNAPRESTVESISSLEEKVGPTSTDSVRRYDPGAPLIVTAAHERIASSINEKRGKALVAIGKVDSLLHRWSARDINPGIVNDLRDALTDIHEAQKLPVVIPTTECEPSVAKRRESDWLRSQDMTRGERSFYNAIAATSPAAKKKNGAKTDPKLGLVVSHMNTVSRSRQRKTRMKPSKTQRSST